MNSEQFQELISSLAKTPENPEVIYELAKLYEAVGQTAAAAALYVKAAEFGESSHVLLSYTALLKAALCLDNQGGRDTSVEHTLLLAQSFLPHRPESFFLLSRFYERRSRWQHAYTMSDLGILICADKYEPLPDYVEYPGKYGFLFEKAVCGWWLGRRDESVSLFTYLLDREEMAAEYLNLCLYNLSKIG